jgi:hypothetical protein
MKSIFFMVLTLLLMSRCDKDSNTPDYRDKYLGSYNCTKTGNYHCGDSNYYYYDTTEIVFVTKTGDSLINILDASVKIDSNGEFGKGLYPDPNYHLFSGHFIDDSIFFGLQQGPLGCFTRFNYKGIKQ